MRKIDRLDHYAELKSINDNRITMECGLAVGTLGKSRKAGKDISRKTAAAILERFKDLNPEWLLTGEGEMLRDSSEVSFASFPLLDTAVAECGHPFGELNSEVENELPRIALPNIPPNTDFFIKAKGYSMVNTQNQDLSIPPGAYVGLQKITGNVLRWGEIYALATTDGIMIKRILRDDNPEMVRCASYNSVEYPDFSIPRSDIYEYAKITCVIPVYIR